MIIDRYNDYDYYEDERLYSTGSNELDDLLERAFCEGYEYALEEKLYFQVPKSDQYYTAVDPKTGRASYPQYVINRGEGIMREVNEKRKSIKRAATKRVKRI